MQEWFQLNSIKVDFMGMSYLIVEMISIKVDMQMSLIWLFEVRY